MAGDLAIELIRRNGGTQPCTTLNLHWVEEYAQDMLAGAVFPPVITFYDGTDHWLADGFHRTEAALATGAAVITADVRQGTRRDAALFSVSANGTHGQRRTNEDKRRAVLTLLDDSEWAGWSDREIARRCGVSDPFVGKLRPADTANVCSMPSKRTFVHPRTGKPTTMSTGNIGRRVEEPQQRFDREAADLHRDAMAAISHLAAAPPPDVQRAADWLAEFATLYAAEEPVRAQQVQAWIASIGGSHVAA